ncbi:Ig-like domain-containing protein [Streptomyces sp. NPDC086787]|uniref:L,D-transpeptidase n=1 Tax=Streptomyces sp. NPDC086787 TaxID=3365759 RepID=UPI00380C8F7F
MNTPDIAVRRALGACAALMVGALTLTACGGSATADNNNDGKGDKGSSKTSAAHIAISAKDGATNASINATGVQVSDGKLTDVKMTSADSGKAVAGTMSADGKSWKPQEKLELGTKYSISASAKDAEGLTSTAKSVFTTVSKSNSFVGNFNPDDGTTVGVGMPVSFRFNKNITEKKAVKSHITVTSSSGQEVVGRWLKSTQGDRLDFRPENYWKAGSKVTVKIALDGVEGAKGVYGVQSKTVTFNIGRSQVSTVDVNTQTMTVVRDGRTLKSVPISAGSPENLTYNGQMVISEKHTQYHMSGRTVGFGKDSYDISDVPHAMRLTDSGTFVHGNYWYPKGNPPFGNRGTSHGCVGLQDVKGAQGDTNGKWFYDNSIIGDVVVVKNSPDKQVTPGNGYSGWNMPWSEWRADSSA